MVSHAVLRSGTYLRQHLLTTNLYIGIMKRTIIYIVTEAQRKARSR